MRSRRVLVVAVSFLVVAAVAGAAVAVLWGGRPTPTGPNVVLIVTDDQRWDTLSRMPNVQRLLVQRGVTFSNGFVVNSLCCPSRASILTGRYSHSTGVYTEQPPFGGAQRFDDSSTVATWLHDAGYRTGLFGKYLNGYRGTSVPQGWDEWLAFQQNESHGYYRNYSVNDDGVIRRYGSQADDYSTDVLARRAVSFVRSSDRSFFLYFAPYAPHGPADPAPRDRGTVTVGDLPRFDPPSFDEADVSDKPAWMHSLPPVTRADVDAFRVRQYESLLAVDRAVGEIVHELDVSHRLRRTVIVFVSDNGLAWGEHRWTRKEVPYEESIRVPYVIRYDRLVSAPRVDPHLALNIDLAPTIAALAGVEADAPEGRSLVPLLAGRDVRWRSDFLVEHVEGRTQPDPPTFCAVRTERYLFAVYATGEVELYDLRTDPFELRNIAQDQGSLSVIVRLRDRLAALCRPPPPGFSSP
ncbi:MAG: sulfatase [Actinomycetota bacterium]